MTQKPTPIRRKKPDISTFGKTDSKISRKCSAHSSTTRDLTAPGTVLRVSARKFTISATFPTEHSARCWMDQLLEVASPLKPRMVLLSRKHRSHWLAELQWCSPDTK